VQLNIIKKKACGKNKLSKKGSWEIEPTLKRSDLDFDPY
jgi:hypothetical protein